MASSWSYVILKRLTCQPINSSRSLPPATSRHNVFISHRGVDTRKTVAGLLYDRFLHLGLRPFLVGRSMEEEEEEEKLKKSIKAAVADCKVGVAVFSPKYCESYSCLRELAMMVEAKKRLIPIFCDVKPSALRLSEEQRKVYSQEKVERFERALQEVRLTELLGIGVKNRRNRGQEHKKRQSGP
ncbi:probable 2' cyclic ADP-D-ribose synthase BdTIR [Typha latifolia]|uniref:probable 2' cyclic ADP-D-ribose synthase BdTIR n=1 Tax=Typha latifolia TaxID=4733 RepID=UPI003C2BDDAC